MRMPMARKIICVVAAVLFLINDICFGLGVMPGSTQKATKDGMYAAAQRLLAVGRGQDVINFDESNLPRKFEGRRELLDPTSGVGYIGYASKYQTNFVPADYENPPTGWKNNPILKETNLIKAFEIFRDTEARIPAGRLEIKEGWFPVNEDAGELPIARIERTREGGYVLIIHTKFVRMWNHIRENDVWFELYMGEYDRRTVSAAWGIFYRLAKHEMAELSKLGDTFKSPGHISYNPESLPQDDETLANKIGGNYALVNDAIWLWFVGAYCFNDKTRYDNDEFLKRIDWFFDSKEARALKLHLEFPNLIEDPGKRMLAKAFAFTINHDFFNRSNIRGPIDLNSVNPKFKAEYEERLAQRKDLGITEAPMYAAGDDKNATAAQAPIDGTKEAYTPVEVLPDEMQDPTFSKLFHDHLGKLTNKQQKQSAIEEQFKLARELAKLIQILDSFEGRYHYKMKHMRASDDKPFSRKGFAKFNQERVLQILKKSGSVENALRMVGIAQLIAQDIKAQIENNNEVYKLKRIGNPGDRIGNILVKKVDLLTLIDKALSIHERGLEVKAIVEGLVFVSAGEWYHGDRDMEHVWIPKIDIFGKPAASQPVKQAIEKPREQPTASAGERSFNKQVGMIRSFLKEKGLSENCLVIDKKQLPTPYLKISGEAKLADISWLAEATILKGLALTGTSVENIGPVASMVNLERLSLSFNPISDIRTIANLKRLIELYLDWTQVANLTPLKGLALKVLDISRTQVTDLTPLKGMNLARLVLDGAKSITDEQKQIYELFKNHPNPKRLEIINSLGELITYDNVQIFIGGYPAYTGDKGVGIVELLPGEMQTWFFTRFFNHQLRRLTKGRPDAIEKRFEIARELAKLIKTLDSFEGRYYYEMEHWRASDGKPFSREGFAKFNQERVMQILKKSGSVKDALRMISIAQLIAQDIKPQIKSNKVYRLPKIGFTHERIDDILMKVDLLPLIDNALSAYMEGLKFEVIVKGLVFGYMDALGRDTDVAHGGIFYRIYVPQIDIEPTEPAQGKPAASQPVEQAIEKPREQPAASAGGLSFDEQLGAINSFLENNKIGKNNLILTERRAPIPYLKISGEINLTDISLLAKAPILKALTLAGTSVEDISPVAKLVNLERLSLSFNPIKDISAVANLKNLRELYLDWAQVADLSPLKGLALDVLDLSLTQVTDLSPLKGMNLARLVLEGAKSITDEQKQIYELFQNHPNPKNLEVINSLGELITYDNVQIFIGGYPAYTGDSGGIEIKEAKTPLERGVDIATSLVKSQKVGIIKEGPGQEAPLSFRIVSSPDGVQIISVTDEDQPAASQPGKQTSEEPRKQPAAESVKKESTLIDDISEYIVRVGLGEGPGAVELSSDAAENIYKTIELLHESQIEIFVPQSFKLTENMKKALEDIGKREGRGPIQCREYSDDQHLLRLLSGKPPSGVKRIVLEEPQDKKSAFLSYHAHKNPEVFRFIRLLSVRLPQGYQEMESGVKTAHQAKMMTMAILARLFENDKTPMVETLLKGMLRESLDINDDALTRFMNELGMSDEEINNLSPHQVGQRIIYFLGMPIRLVEKIGREIDLMKAFWRAA